MGELVNEHGNKAAGQLIQSEDWNAIVAAIETFEATLSERVEELEASLTARIQRIEEQLGPLVEQVDALRASIEPILGEYLRLTMQTARTSYAIGEQAKITARLLDLQGNDMTFDVASRPTIDFFSSWGQLSPVAGFESRGGVGDRTISVRVNTVGVAEVLLRTEFAEGLNEEADSEVAAALTTRLPSNGNNSIAETILAAETPAQAKESGAFRLLTQEYDRSDAISVRGFVDAHYLRNTALRSPSTRFFGHRWRDYRATVMAFAKTDADPRTPDQARGVSSIQVTFRDWIGPWIVLDYLTDTGSLVEQFRDRLIPKVTRNFSESIVNLKDEVTEFVRGQGVVARQRNYQVMQAALDQVSVPQPPAFLNTLTRSMKDAIGMQASMDLVQGAAINIPQQQEIAFEAFANADARSDVSAAEVRSEIAALQEGVDEVDRKIQRQVSEVVTARVADLERPGGAFDSIRAQIQTVSGQVGALRDIGDVTDVKQKLAQVQVLSDQFNNIVSRSFPLDPRRGTG